MSIVSVRVPKELKKKMDSLKRVINWSEEIRRFIEKKVIEIEQKKAIEELEEFIKKMPVISKGTAIQYVREDRDSH